MAEDKPIFPGGSDSHPEPGQVDSPPEHPSVRFEVRDIKFWHILVGALVTVTVGSIQLYLVYQIFRAHERGLAERRLADFPLARHLSTSLPVEPRLEQIDRLSEVEGPNVYLRQLKKEKALARYGLTSEKDFVHVPIQRAIDFLASRLPVRKQFEKETGKGNGLVDAGESNSGRMFRKEPP